MLADGSRPSQRGATPPANADDALCNLTAIELVERLRRKQVSARDVMAAHLARIERVNPKVNAIVTLVADRAMADAARADELTARGGTLGVLHGLPVAHKDLVDTAGIRTTCGSRVLPRPRADARRADRAAAARRRRDHGRQDQHAGVRRGLADLQRGVRRDAQSVRPDQDLRRQQRRRRGRAGLRHGADRRRQRHGRLAAQSGRLLQRRRPASVAGPRAERGGVVVAAVGVWADGAHRRRRRAAAERDRRSRSARVRSRFRKTARAFARRSIASFKGARVAWWKGWAAFRSSRRSARRRRATDTSSRPRLHRRGGRTGLHRRRRGVPRCCDSPPITRSTATLIRAECRTG